MFKPKRPIDLLYLHKNLYGKILRIKENHTEGPFLSVSFWVSKEINETLSIRDLLVSCDNHNVYTQMHFEDDLSGQAYGHKFSLAREFFLDRRSYERLFNNVIKDVLAHMPRRADDHGMVRGQAINMVYFDDNAVNNVVRYDNNGYEIPPVQAYEIE